MSYTQGFYDSYERIFGKGSNISESGMAFFDRFYDLFTQSSTIVSEAFQHTDMQHQKRMLRKSLLYCVGFTLNEQDASLMAEVARSHDVNHHDITPVLYDLWLDTMITTVREFDPCYDANVELCWRVSLAPGISYIKFMHRANISE